MLRLVGGQRSPPALQRVSIWGLDQELAGYVERRLHARWPQLIVQHVRDAASFDLSPADLWICGVAPPEGLNVPALWLGDVDRGNAVVRVGERLWKCSTPITGRQLERSIEALWRQLP